MRIVYDDIIYSLQKAGGISHYWTQLEDKIDYDKRLLYRRYDDNIFYKDRNKLKDIIYNNNPSIERVKPVMFNAADPFVFHSSYYRFCKNENAINVTTIHDFIYEYYRHDIKSCLHKIQKKNAVFHSKAVICISENTKKDLLKYYPDYKGKVKVIYEGVSESYHSDMNIQRQNHVLFIGGRQDYKNFNYAVQIMKRLPSNMVLQIVDGGALRKDEIILLNACIPGRYVYYKNLSNEELNIKYNEAKFLLYPSLYEGFGLPVLEAQAAGCPVVCCNVSSLPEIGGDSVLYISGINVKEDAALISQLENKVFYSRLREKGYENCKKYSWKNCTEQTYDFYQEVYNKFVEEN